ncbi:redoxin domain-containing protein [Halanaerobacter jeridensis]|uniref:Peroxiredoxin n=1 Tax=Halanaerobacter jeridensis TaxID=706427 RepID=A0A938XS54_9FIRM|nr:redoxin domain-containing protein [Halanaerobacter jeridensis]MBM7556799.1 peroxiredoxin [Halanaerobacter jeridensis]
MTVEVGTKINDFTLTDHNENEVNLSDLEGQKVLLSFHPLAFTSVCANQMQGLEANYEELEELNIVPLGISIDAVPAKKAWAEELGLEKLQLVSDFWPHGGLAKELGIFRDEDGFSERANILLDENGEVIYSQVYEISELPDPQEIIDFVKGSDE